MGYGHYERGTWAFIEVDLLDAENECFVELGLRRLQDYLVACAAMDRFDQEDT